VTTREDLFPALARAGLMPALAALESLAGAHGAGRRSDAEGGVKGLELIGPILARLGITARDEAGVKAAFAALRRRPGDWWWCGDSCFRCTGVTPDSSHREELVATYDPETSTSECPTCGRTVHWADPPRVRDDPRCIRCADDAAAGAPDEGRMGP